MSRRHSLLALFSVVPVVLVSTAASALPDPKVTITYSAAVADGGEYWFETAGTALGVFDFRARLCEGCELWTGNVVDVRVNQPDGDVFFVIEYTADGSGNIIDGPVELTEAYFDQHFEVDGTSAFGDATILTDVLIELAEIGTGTLSGSTITWDPGSYWVQTIGQVDCTGGLCIFSGPWPVVADPDAIPSSDPNDDNPAPVDLPTFTVFTNSLFADSVVSDNGTPLDFTDDLVAVDPGGAGTARNTWYGEEVDRVVPEPSGTLLLIAGLGGLLALERTKRSER